jgi:predicted Zn-dependent protease
MRSTSRLRTHGPTFTKALVVVAFAAAAALALLPVTAAQADDQHDIAGQYTWEQRVVTVSSTVSSTWGVRSAVHGWNAHRVAGQPRLVVRNHAAHPDLVIKTVSRPGQWWTGYTTGTSDASTITSITISLNTASISQSRYQYDGSLDAAKQWTTSHELGHALGLEHSQSVKRSVMSYSNPWWKTSGQPSGYDFRRLNQLY